MDGGRFRTEAWKADSGNCDSMATGLSGFDVTGRVLSFGYFSLHQQRKVARPQGRKPLTLTVLQKDQNLSPWRARYFLLLAQKKVPKEKGLPRDVKTAQAARYAVAIFGIGLPGLSPKTPAIHGRRPPGVRFELGM